VKVELCQLCSSPIPKPCRCKTGTSRPEAAWRIFGLPSGKHSHDYGNSQFSTGKSKYFYGSFSSLPEGTPFVVDFPIENGLQTGPLVLQRAPPRIMVSSRSQGLKARPGGSGSLQARTMSPFSLPRLEILEANSEDTG